MVENWVARPYYTVSAFYITIQIFSDKEEIIPPATRPEERACRCGVEGWPTVNRKFNRISGGQQYSQVLSVGI